MGGPRDALHDISHKTLEIAEKLGMPYLSKAKETDAKTMIEGCFHEKYGSMRAIVPLVVSLGDEARWVFFVVGCGIESTYLSKRVSAATFYLPS